VKPLYLLFGFISLLCWPSWQGWAADASGAEVTAEIDPREIYLGQSLTLRVLVPGDALAVIDVSGIADMTVIPRGRVLGARGSGGEVVAAYRFELVPRRVGELMVPSLAVETGGTRRLTGPVTARVLPRPTPPNTLSGQDLLLDAVSGRDTPYVGEAFPYTLRLYRAVAAAAIHLAPPDFPGFSVVPLPGQRDGEIEAAGRRYVVAEVDYLLTPLRPGRVVLPRPTALCRGVAGKTKDATLSGPSLPLSVRPLPPYDGPAVPTGLIGRMELAAGLEDAPGNSGREIVYVLTLSGRGNLKDFSAPALPLPDGLTAKPLPAEASGGYGPTGYAGQRIFRFVLTAEHPGEYLLPAVAWAVFDPEAGSYRTAAAQALSFRAALTPDTIPGLVPPLLHGPDAPAARPPGWPQGVFLALLPIALFVATLFRRPRHPKEQAGAIAPPPAALAEALRKALDTSPDRSSTAWQKAAACLAGLDRLLYAGEPTDAATIEAATTAARQALRGLP
jgi:hypothetical protein